MRSNTPLPHLITVLHPGKAGTEAQKREEKRSDGRSERREKSQSFNLYGTVQRSIGYATRLAQLVEHGAYDAAAMGSNPIVSISLPR